MPATTVKYLGIYLNDHLAGSTGGLELTKRAAGEHQDTELGRFLSTLLDDIAEDRKVLESLMSGLGITPNPAKQAAAWAAEKAGRLKPNGEVRGTSPLTPLVELETLSLGVEGKRLMWLALSEVPDLPLSSERLAELVARAQQQREGVERYRREAARQALN
ncbi:MAG: transaldolase [Baekduia sp.]|jgi:hypothetical protein|nr:transaldolase [Baekduia sp.]